MKRKISILLGACVALVALSSFSTAAFALVDQDCDGDPHNNNPVIHDFTITPDSDIANKVSGYSGSGLVCGSHVSSLSANPVEYAKIQLANGIAVTDPQAAGVPVDAVAGPPEGNTVRVLQRAFGVVTNPTYVNVLLTVEDKSVCAADSASIGEPFSEAQIISCLRAETSILGNNNIWTVAGEAGAGPVSYIGPIKTLGGIGVAGITRITYTICDNFGAPGSDACGSSSDVAVGTNGDATSPNCGNGNGIYTAQAFFEDDTSTPVVSTCVELVAPTNCRDTSGPASRLCWTFRAQSSGVLRR